MSDAGFPLPDTSAFQNAQDVWSYAITKAWEELLPGVTPDLVSESAIITSNGYGWAGYYDNLKARAALFGGQTTGQRLVAIAADIAAIKKKVGA